MKLFIVSALFVVCSALPQGYYGRTAPSYSGYQETRPRAGLERTAAILRSDSDVNEHGFHYAFETENGIQAEESGQEADGIQAQGGFSYTGDDGQVYSVRYTADGNGGFQAQGAHLPTPPPIPAEIAQALQDNARDEANGIFDDGSYHAGKYDNAPVAVARQFAAPAAHQFAAPGYRSQPRYPY